MPNRELEQRINHIASTVADQLNGSAEAMKSVVETMRTFQISVSELRNEIAAVQHDVALVKDYIEDSGGLAQRVLEIEERIDNVEEVLEEVDNVSA